MIGTINLWWWKQVSKILPIKWLRKTIDEAEEHYKNKNIKNGMRGLFK